MDSSLQEIWQTAPGSPFLPTVGKSSQFLVGFTLLLFGLGLTGAFALSEYLFHTYLALTYSTNLPCLDRSLVNLPIYGLPASLAVAYVSSCRITHPTPAS